jgi:hypothetical protein
LVVGRSGELAVMSELLWRGWTPARPEIDIGDDVFIIDDDIGTFWRIQVKTATASNRKGNAHNAQFRLRLDQLHAAPTPDLYYVFVIRSDNLWTDFVIVPRGDLRDEHERFGVGSTSKGGLTLNLYCRADRSVLAGTSPGTAKRDWTRYRDQWPSVAS